MKMNVKRAIILAAGKGKRMGEITQTLPKPMVQVLGKPILEHIIEGLRDHAAIQEFFIITGHCAEVIENHFQNGSKWNVQIRFGRQEVPDGTGKAALPAKSWAGDAPFLLTYGDILLSDPGEYGDMVNVENADGVISVKSGEDVKLGGAVVFDEKFYLKDLIEKAAPGTVDSKWYNAGIYIFPPVAFDYMEKLQKSVRGEYELTDAVRSLAIDGKRISGYEIKHKWADVRDPQVLAAINEKRSLS